MQIFSESIEINAPDHVVYDVIADLSQYKNWNPWIYDASGAVAPNAKVLVKMKMAGKERTFDHRIISAIRPHTFHWCDVGWFTVLAFGDRIRHIEASNDNHCRYRVDLRVKGPGEHLTRWLLGNFLQEGLAKETHALKVRAESLSK